MKLADRASAVLGVSGRKVATILALAVALRVAMWFLVAYRTDVGDASSYLASARNLVDYGVYSDLQGAPPAPTAYRPPLYPVFVAAAGRLGDPIWAVRVLQILLSLLTAALTTRLAFRLAPASQPVALALIALSPFEAVYAGAHLSECLCTALLVAGAVALAEAASWRGAMAAGGILGAACLTRDVYLPLAAVGGLASLTVLHRHSAARTRGRMLAAFMFGLMLLVGPWMLRNLSVTGKASLSGGRLGYSLWIASWATSTEWSWNDASGAARVYPAEAYRNVEEEKRIMTALANVDRDAGDQILKEIAIDRWRSEPITTTLRSMSKIPKLWFGTRFDIFRFNPALIPAESPLWIAAKSFLWGMNALALALGCLGLGLAVLKRQRVLFAAVPPLYTVAVYFVLNTMENRYSKPMEPFYLVLGAYAVVTLGQRFRGRSDARRSVDA